jgi:hypothetical protein
VPNEVALVLASPPPPATAELLQPVGDHSAVDATRSSSVSSSPDAADGVAPQRHHDDFESISFAQALMVPGVLAYSACLFFSKLVSQPHSHNRLPQPCSAAQPRCNGARHRMASLSLCSLVPFSPRGCCCWLRQVAYAFIFWLPFYLSNLNYSDTDAGNISTVYDIGGVAGGIIAGYASDLSGKRGLVSVTMLLLSLPGLWAYSFLAQYGMAINIVLMFIVSEKKTDTKHAQRRTSSNQSFPASRLEESRRAARHSSSHARSLSACLSVCLSVML